MVLLLVPPVAQCVTVSTASGATRCYYSYRRRCCVVLQLVLQCYDVVFLLVPPEVLHGVADVTVSTAGAALLSYC